MKTWFDKNRIKMFNKACNGMLRTEICNGLSIREMENVLRTLESFNKGELAQNGGVKIESHDVDLGSEIAQAISAEVVSVEDEKFIKSLRTSAQKTIVIDFDHMKTNDENPHYVGDKFNNVIQEIVDIHKILDTGKQFILCAPLELSVLQSAQVSHFAPTIEGSFKGPNNSMMTGNMNKVPVYSYIPQLLPGEQKETNWDNGEYLVGVYYDKQDKCIIHKLAIKNVSFV